MKDVLIIYTGGTIGMEIDTESGVLIPFSLTSLLSQMPELKEVKANLSSYSFEEPIDSANASVDTWMEIGNVIFQKKDTFDAFVVLHGTDTMAYSATACSFMLQGLEKPIIFTGSQLPISHPNTDAKENVLGVFELLTKENKKNPFVEVGLYFHQKLFRATRVTKIHSSSFDGFGSPNTAPMFEKGRMNSSLFLNSKTTFSFQPHFSQKGIAVVTWHPLLNKELFLEHLKPGVNILILQSYGSGTLPTYPWLMDALRKFSNSGGIVINKTQCYQGKVDQGVYETSNMLNKIGVIPANDMTLESVIVKAAWLYYRKPNVLEFKLAFFKDYCGEMG